MRSLIVLFLFFGTSISAIAQRTYVSDYRAELLINGLQSNQYTINYLNLATPLVVEGEVATYFLIDGSDQPPFHLETVIYIDDPYFGEVPLGSPIIVDKSDLDLSTYIPSKRKPFSIEVPLHLRFGKLKSKYRLAFNGNIGAWKGTLTDFGYTFDTTLKITGEGTICVEEVYEVDQGAVVTLENASGIATLTNLGGDQYKIVRTPNANGKIVLKVVRNSMVATKNIEVGSPQVSINGPSTINALSGIGIQDATFSVALPTPGSTYTWSVIGGSPGRVIFPSGNTGNSVIVHVKNHDNLGTNPFNYTIRVTTTNACGISSYSTRTFKVYPAQPGGGPL